MSEHAPDPKRCSDCKGSGFIGLLTCSRCSGSGKPVRVREVRIDAPTLVPRPNN